MKKHITHLAICGIGLGMLMSAGCAQRPLFSTHEMVLNEHAGYPVQQAPMMTNSVPTAAAPAVNYIQPPPLGAPAGGPVAPFASTAAAVPNNAIAPVPAGYVAPAPVVPEPKVEPENPLPSSLAKTVPAIYKYSPDASQSLGTEKQLSEFCREIAGKVYYELKQNGSKHLTSRVAVVDAVPLSDLKRETEFGRLISEYMLTDLADRGLKVTELRLGREINILPQTGEFILSRNIGELASDAPMLDYVLVSTFTNTRKTLILQGRLVGLKSGLVETSWRYTLPLNRELLGLFNASDEQPFTIAVNGMSR